MPGDRPSKPEIEEARRLLYVGMTRAKERLVMTRATIRGGKPTGATQFLDEMGLTARAPHEQNVPSMAQRDPGSLAGI